MKRIAIRLAFGLLMLMGMVTAISQLSAQTSTDKKEQEKDALVTKAEGQFANGKVDECMKTLEEAAGKNPLLPPAKLMMARLMLGNQQTAQGGRQLLEAAIAENPDHPECYLTNGSLALAEGRVTDTLSNCQIAMQLAEADRWTANQRKTFRKEAAAGLATAFENRRDWSAARKSFQTWSELDPKNVQVRQRLARAIFMSGKHGDALEVLKEAAREDDAKTPTLDPAEVTMALLYSSIIGTEDPKKTPAQDYAKEAVKYFEDAIEKYTDKPRAHQAYAGWLLDTGKTAEAKKHIDAAQKIEGMVLSRESKALLGLYERYMGNHVVAENFFADILRLYPADFFSSNQLALVLIEQPAMAQQQRAEQLAEVNVRQYQRSAEAYATLGWIYLKLGRLEQAERALAVASNSGQVSPDTAFYLAKLLQKREKYKEGYDVIKKANESKAAFINRKPASELEAELKTKLPKDEEKKPTDPK